jgi:outer membrane protein TolC
MMKTKQIFLLPLVFFVVSWPVRAEVLGLAQAIQQALAHRTELQSARLSSQSAVLGLSATESQLGWQATASAGWQHQLDALGQPADQSRLSAGLMKQQRSGNQLNLQGSYQKDDSDISGASLFPNPLESYGVNLDYRIPLQQGKGNLNYAYAEAQAQMNIAVARAQERATRERISEQLINVYHRLLELQIQIQENQRAIERTIKLEAFIQKNSQLGLAEAKDRLSVRARLAAQRADGRRLQREWTAQLVDLKKLTGVLPGSVTVVNFTNTKNLPHEFTAIVKQVEKRDAVITSNQEKLALTESLLELNRDRQKDKFDVVLSLGNETRQGERTGTALDENEWTGGVRLEYQLPLDRTGVDATTRQTLLELDQIRLENERYKNDLQSLLQQWYREWQLTHETANEYRLRKQIELKKYQEVKGRYLEGRTDIREMLEAEESLTLAQQQLAREQARGSLLLALLSNRLGLFYTGNEG